MKVAGALTLIAGLVAAVIFCLLPAHQSELGTTLDCGVPLRGMFGYRVDPSDLALVAPIYQQCQQQSTIRVVIGGAVGSIGLVGGLLMLLLGPSNPVSPLVATTETERRPKAESPRQVTYRASGREDIRRNSPSRWWLIPVAVALAIAAGAVGALYQRHSSTTSSSLKPAEAATSLRDPSARTSIDPEPTPLESPSVVAGRWLGYGTVKLGMDLRELRATGQVRDVPLAEEVGCTDFPMKAGGTATFSSSQGQVVYITFKSEMKTSAGIEVGSSSRQVTAAYPGAQFDSYGETRISIGAGVSYLIALSNGVVSELILMSDSQDCAG